MSIEHGTMSSEHRTASARRGIVLLVTMVVLLVLSTLCYNLATRVAAQRYRDNYIIDYTSACYARDSAIKYALTTLQDLNDIVLVDRPNEPDFSDLFSMSEEKYRQMLDDWAKELAKREAEKEQGNADDNTNFPDVNFREALADENLEDLFDLDKELNDVNTAKPKTAKPKTPGPNTIEPNIAETNAVEPNFEEPNSLENVKIPGPYGPPWPYVTEPAELEIGNVKVKIEIEDENAKYPLGWAVLGNDKITREREASLKTFCEWMGVDPDGMKQLQDQLKQVASIKPFKLEFKVGTLRTTVTPQPRPANPRRGTRPQRTAYKTTTISTAEQTAKQTRDFSRLFHSSLIDTETLARPTVISDIRKESALKYMSLWGTTQVNINSAPRQVLESAFVFGGDAQEIAAEIIKQRKKHPFESIEELSSKLYKFSTSIDKCRPSIAASSNVFSIHVTATSGVAKASAVIVVFKEGGKIERIAVVSG